MKPTKMNSHGKVLKGRATTRTIKPATDAQIAAGRAMLMAGTAIVPVAAIPAKKARLSQVKRVPLTEPTAALVGQRISPRVAMSLPPPPPPPKAASVLDALPPRPMDATYLEYSRPATYRDGVMVDPGVTIVAPANACGNFSSFKTGTVRWGKLRYDEDFVPVGEVPTTDEPSAPKPPPPPKAPKGPKKAGVCAFIDALVMKGGKTAQQIADLALAQFPGRDAKATLSTVKVRPSHLKAKGLVPPPFKA